MQSTHSTIVEDQNMRAGAAHQLGGARRGARGKVLLLHQRSAQAPARAQCHTDEPAVHALGCNEL